MTFQPETYQNIGYDQLTIYSAFLLQQQNKEVTFEELVKEAFENFPLKFRLHIKDRDWPDASLINKAWLRCRTDKKWIVGSRASGFALTPAGVRASQGVAKSLKVAIGSKRNQKTFGDQTRSTKIINGVLNTVAFFKFQHKALAKISELEFCESIFCTLDTPQETKLKNLELVRQYADGLQQKEVIKYLNAIQKKFIYLLDPPKNKYTGGMMRKRV